MAKKPTKDKEDDKNDGILKYEVDNSAASKEQGELDRVREFNLLGDIGSQLLMAAREVCGFSDVMSSSATGNIEDYEYCDTGIPALNMLISGSFKKGLPPRICGLSGISQSGKTYIGLRAAARAQKKGVLIIFFDSEGSVTRQTMEKHGIDVSKVIFIPVHRVNAFGAAATLMLDKLEVANFVQCPITKKLRRKPRGQYQRVMFIVDSLGMMSNKSDAASIVNDTNTVGQKAKDIRAVFRELSNRMAIHGICMLFTNHVSESMPKPGQSSAPQIISGGGKGPEYSATVLILFKSRALREDQEKSTSDIVGTQITAKCLKNRMVPPLTEIVIDLNFEEGVDEYSGLFELGVEAGLIKQNGSWYSFNDTKVLGKAGIMALGADKIFTSEFMDKLDVWVQKEFCYRSDAISNEVEVEDVVIESDK
jgi:RecA/RadA recombinase